LIRKENKKEVMDVRHSNRTLFTAIVFVLGIFSTAFFGIKYYNAEFWLKVPDAVPLFTKPHGLLGNPTICLIGLGISIVIAAVSCIVLVIHSVRKK
jgi:hypothetical protein